MQNKTPRNEQGEPHGIWEEYDEKGKLIYTANYVNGKRYGRCEKYWSDGSFFIAYMVDDVTKGYLKTDWMGCGFIQHTYIAK